MSPNEKRKTNKSPQKRLGIKTKLNDKEMQKNLALADSAYGNVFPVANGGTSIGRRDPYIPVCLHL